MTDETSNHMLADARAALRTILTETFDGATGGSSWYIDGVPDGSLLGMLKSVDWAEATRAAAGRRSIAAHAGHAMVHVDVVERYLRGDSSPADWEASWRLGDVDAAGWTRLQAELGESYRRLLATIAAKSDWTELMLAGAIGAIAHAAYHLGAMRQIIKNARSK